MSVLKTIVGASSDKDLYAKATVLKQIEASGYEVGRVETFLPMQDIYVCRPSN